MHIYVNIYVPYQNKGIEYPTVQCLCFGNMYDVFSIDISIILVDGLVLKLSIKCTLFVILSTHIHA